MTHDELDAMRRRMTMKCVDCPKLLPDAYPFSVCDDCWDKAYDRSCMRRLSRLALWRNLADAGALCQAYEDGCEDEYDLQRFDMGPNLNPGRNLP